MSAPHETASTTDKPPATLLFDPGADIILRSRDPPGNATSELINSGGTAPWLTCCWTVCGPRRMKLVLYRSIRVIQNRRVN